MADQTHISPPAASDATPVTTSTTTTTVNATSTPSITIPQTQQKDEIQNARESIISPTHKKTGTRSTFCTRIKPCTHPEEKKDESPRPTGFLEMLGVRQQTNFGDTSVKDDEPIQHSYY
ncbi:hypothetical protein BGW41_003514 [Actinomortierella wolfii]|nr:hypothetical protein BGW41_003514 [Actinomortierella wolfii]